MIFKGQKANDFTLLPAPRNNCAGCWFYNQKPRCTTRRATPFIKDVFLTNKGSCVGVIAVLVDEVDKLKKIA